MVKYFSFLNFMPSHRKKSRAATVNSRLFRWAVLFLFFFNLRKSVFESFHLSRSLLKETFPPFSFSYRPNEFSHLLHPIIISMFNNKLHFRAIKATLKLDCHFISLTLKILKQQR